MHRYSSLNQHSSDGSRSFVLMISAFMSENLLLRISKKNGLYQEKGFPEARSAKLAALGTLPAVLFLTLQDHAGRFPWQLLHDDT